MNEDAGLQIKGYYTWNTPLSKGQRYTVAVGYPDDAFAFDIDKTIQKGVERETYEEEDDIFYIIGDLITLGIFGMIIWGIISFIKSMVEGIVDLFTQGSGFKSQTRTEKKIARTKVVHCPSCQECGAPQPEGQDTCAYCRRSFIKSEEIVEEKDIPAAEEALKSKKANGVYAYTSEPDTFLRVNVVPVAVSAPRRSYSSGSRSSCACTCGCACGGRAGCTTKDFYNTNLKLIHIDCPFSQ